MCWETQEGLPTLPSLLKLSYLPPDSPMSVEDVPSIGLLELQIGRVDAVHFVSVL